MVRRSMAILLIKQGHPEEQQWHSAIGRAVVSFGTLERHLLYRAAGVRQNYDLSKAYHKEDMKKIVELVVGSLESYKQRLSPEDYGEATRLLSDAPTLDVLGLCAPALWPRLRVSEMRPVRPSQPSRAHHARQGRPTCRTRPVCQSCGMTGTNKISTLTTRLTNRLPLTPS
jgi:hypothetical protein